MSDLIRKIGELHLAAVIDYNEKAEKLKTAEAQYDAGFYGSTDAYRATIQAAMAEKEAAILAAEAQFTAARNAAQAAHDAKVAELDAAYEPVLEAERAAKVNFDKIRLAWAAVVDDVAVGGLDDGEFDEEYFADGEDDHGEEADEDEEETAVRGEAEVQPEEGIVIDATQPQIEGPAFPDVDLAGTLTVDPGVAVEPVVIAEPTVAPVETVSGEPAIIDGAPAAFEQGTVVEEQPAPVVDLGPVTPVEAPADTMVAAVEPAPVVETVVEPAPVVETAVEAPVVVEPAPVVETVEPVPPLQDAPPVEPAPPEVVVEPTDVTATEPLPPVEAKPEAPTPFPAEFGDVPFPVDFADVPVGPDELAATQEVTEQQPGLFDEGTKFGQ